MGKEAITMPRFGSHMKEGKVLEWYVKAGDHVNEDDLLLKIKAEKTDADVEALWSGTVTEIVAQVDESFPVGATLGYIETDA